MIITHLLRSLLVVVLLGTTMSVSAQIPDEDEWVKPGNERTTRFKTSVRPSIADVIYGPGKNQRFDVYVNTAVKPMHASNHRPTIIMVHGGGWQRGDKRLPNTVENKVKYFVNEQGWALVSVGYDFVPHVQVNDQIRQLHQAIASVQQRMHQWNGHPSQTILIGHSAGAHLAMMVTAQPEKWKNLGVIPWAGTVSLDAGALDVGELMRHRAIPLYTRAFGHDPGYWEAMSPSLQWKSSQVHVLLVCSSKRRDACPQADTLIGRYGSSQQPMQVMETPMSHGEINSELGLNRSYTGYVETWMRDAIARR